MKKILLILAVSVLMYACDRNAELRSLTEDATIRLSVQGVTQLTYDPSTCQLGFCRQKCEFRVNTDNMSDFFIITLDRIPAVLNSEVTGNIVWTSSSKLEHKENVALEVVKLEGDKIWLWNRQEGVEALVQVLD